MSAVNQPIHKDVSFWIVAVTLVGAATAVQLYFGLPWFSQKYAQSQPAPRSKPDMNFSGLTVNQTPPNPDPHKASQIP